MWHLPSTLPTPQRLHIALRVMLLGSLQRQQCPISFTSSLSTSTFHLPTLRFLLHFYDFPNNLFHARIIFLIFLLLFSTSSLPKVSVSIPIPWRFQCLLPAQSSPCSRLLNHSPCSHKSPVAHSELCLHLSHYPPIKQGLCVCSCVPGLSIYANRSKQFTIKRVSSFSGIHNKNNLPVKIANWNRSDGWSIPCRFSHILLWKDRPVSD